MSNPYKDFTDRLKILVGKHSNLIEITLGNIFTMRLIGNKTHGDLAEIAMAEFINQYMYDFKSIHVGKDLYRAKSHEEDIKIINEITKAEFTVSLKAYGDGPLQLSTDKNYRMFPRLEEEGDQVNRKVNIENIFNDPAFVEFTNVNVLPLIYDEKKKRCNILVFDYDRAVEETTKIVKEMPGSRRKHPVYRFYDKYDDYICEVRYGDSAANALQRGLWTHTKHGAKYFDSVTGGWIGYSDNLTLVKLISHSLVASEMGHKSALSKIIKNIQHLKQGSNS